MNEPDRIGRFEVKEEIGTGGMGTVYRAWDPQLLRDVALKRLHIAPGRPAEERRRGILEEARLAASIRHPAVVSVYDVIEHAGEHYLVQEFVVGTSLRARLDDPVDLGAFFTFLIPCVEALCLAAEHGIVHLDLKPENLMIEPDGKPRILDFGLARLKLVAHEAPGAQAGGSEHETSLIPSPAGTPAYMAPEVIRREEPDPRADIFSLGVVCYEVLSGSNPFRRGSSLDTLFAILHEPVPPLHEAHPHIPERLSRLVERMMDPDRACRPAATEVRQIVRYLAPDDADRGRQPIALPAESQRPLLLVESFAREGEESTPTRHGRVEFADAIRARLSPIRGVDVLDLGHAAAATIVISGKIATRRGSMRVSHRILDRLHDRVIEEGSIEGPIEDPVAILREVCERIAAAVARICGQGVDDPRGHDRTLDPESAGCYLQARSYLRRGQSEADAAAAIELCEKALRLDPESALATAALAEACGLRYFLTKDPQWAERAITHAHRAFSLAPDLPEVRSVMAGVYLTIGRPELARSTYEEILRSDPWNYAARIGLAQSMMQLGRTADAENAFLEAIDLQPDHWLGHNLLGALYCGQGQTWKGVKCFLRVVDLAPDHARGYSNLGAAYLVLGRMDNAMAAFEKAIQLGRDYRALSNMGTLYLSQRRYADAVAMYQQALDVDDRDHRVWNNLSDALRALGRDEDAAHALGRAVDLAERRREINPADPVLLAQLGQYYGELGHKETALRHVERALELAPERVDVLLPAAAVHAAAGERDRAVAEVVRALKNGCRPEALRNHSLYELFLEEPQVQSTLADLEREEGEGRDG